LARLNLLGVDVLVDVALLHSQPELIADFFRRTLITDRPDGLWSTLVVDEMGLALGLAYSNYESLLDALTHRRGTYWSRSRGGLWIKGLTSGNTQRLIGVRVDCDRDCLRFQVTQDGSGFCHLSTYSCFGYERSIATVIDRLRGRCQSSDAGSFTRKLVNDPAMLQAKLLEEASELSAAVSKEEVAFEAADVMYFTLVKMLGAGVELSDVHRELARRMTRVIRRKNKLESN
jgi:phosphoribosyl-ATP pyrophosphohydrolase